jgi:REP element-mobilizing transposase RayT
MGRPTRPTAAGFYHVATRAQVDEQLFRNESDYLRFEQELRSVVHDSAFRCLAACAMTTHYHRFAFADAAFMVSCRDGSLDTLRRFVESEAVPDTA